MCSLGEEDVPAAVRLIVHLAEGGVGVRKEKKGGATAHTGHAAEKGGNAVSHVHTCIFTSYFTQFSFIFSLALCNTTLF